MSECKPIIRRKKTLLENVVTGEEEWTGGYSWIATNKKGKPLGHIITKPLEDTKVLWINELNVISKCRRKGIGTNLLQKATQHAKKTSKQIIYVTPEAGLVGAEKPLRQKEVETFYEKQGFHKCDPNKFHIFPYRRKYGMCKDL